MECGMQGSIAVPLPDKWVPCMTLDLTDPLADALGKERLYSNGEEYYRTAKNLMNPQLITIGDEDR